MEVVFCLVDVDEKIIAVHKTREGAEAHRQNVVMPEWLAIEEFDLEP